MKAVITDLDRTLLHTDKSISAYTEEVLCQCRKQGILVMAATARPLRDMALFEKQVDFDAVTAGNGAVVRLPEGRSAYGIKRESGETVLERILAYPDVFLSVETDQGLYSNRDIPQWQPVVYDRFPTLPTGVQLYKILVSSTCKALYEEIGSILTEDVYHTVANGELIQIMSRDATKWKGILRMLSAFGIDPEDAVYFGDDNDDIEPLKNCGIGVAVENAIPAVLAVADEITADNDHDGAARFIAEKILSAEQ